MFVRVHWFSKQSWLLQKKNLESWIYKVWLTLSLSLSTNTIGEAHTIETTIVRSTYTFPFWSPRYGQIQLWKSFIVYSVNVILANWGLAFTRVWTSYVQVVRMTRRWYWWPQSQCTTQSQAIVARCRDKSFRWPNSSSRTNNLEISVGRWGMPPNYSSVTSSFVAVQPTNNFSQKWHRRAKRL